MIRGDPGRFMNILFQGVLIINNLHGPASQHVGGTYQYGVPDLFGYLFGFIKGQSGSPFRLPYARIGDQAAEPFAVLRQVDAFR